MDSRREQPSAASGFPTRQAVELAAALFARETYPERIAEFSAYTRAQIEVARGRADHLPPVYRERVLLEGPRWIVDVSPGVIAVRRTDPAKAVRAAERALRSHEAEVDLRARLDEAGEEYPPAASTRRITSWSSKSRALMVKRLAAIDYERAGFGSATRWVGVEHRVGMVTLTYPGDWLEVVPAAHVAQGHLRALRKRWERRYGPLVAAWKREFQRRGAPHYHLGGLLPVDPGFPAWLSATWAEIVGASTTCRGECEADRGRCWCSERARHIRSGTGIDWAKGQAAKDPKRFAVYFSKHGAFGAKEYQNEAPPEWDRSEGIGRFWGYWGMTVCTVGVEVAEDVASKVVRTARRWSASKRVFVKVSRWRKVTCERLDPTTGEVVRSWKWRKRRTTVRVRRLTRSTGFLIANDAPRLAEQLAAASSFSPRHDVSPVRPSGRGPVGFLP